MVYTKRPKQRRPARGIGAIAEENRVGTKIVRKKFETDNINQELSTKKFEETGINQILKFYLII